MSRGEYVLAVLAASDGATHTPVQVQKLFFLLDAKAPGHVGGPHFNFHPYDYGPFDKAVYAELRALADKSLVEIVDDPSLGWNRYRLSPAGLEQGTASLSGMPAAIAAYIRELSAWVRSLSFADLITAIYREFPAMKENSVFRG